MSPSPDDTLISRLPLPLAQLYRRAHNAKTPRDAHDCAVYLWEAAIKLFASAAIVSLTAEGEPPADVAEKLKNLGRPSLGHWRELVRLLIPALAGREAYANLAKMIDERRVDLPRSAALETTLRETHKVGGGKRQTVNIAELLDRVVTQRNNYVGHGAPAVLPGEAFRPIADALLAAAAELFPRLDILAGRQLIAVTEIRSVGGNWLIERSELRGVAPWRIASLELPRHDGAGPSLVEGAYLVGPSQPDDASAFLALRPLLDFDAEHETVRFLNGRRGKNVEMLCYVTGSRTLVAPTESHAVVVVPEWDGDKTEPEASATGIARMIGDYELVSELGRGAMGIVYRARQEVLGREVALKVQPRPNDPKADARFRREVRALARVDHPNLVKVFTSGVEAEQFYYTMELLDGAPLTAISDALTRGDSSTAIDLPAWQSALSAACEDVKRGEKPLSFSREAESAEPSAPAPNAALPSADSGSRLNDRAQSRDTIRQIVTLVRQAADAAHALHEAGVLHRDIKPGNIQVTPDGSQAVLLDLGLAQLADDVEGRLTRTTQFVGTRRYASPEQQIDARSIDRRADVYSLGATLWELIALRPLFNATDETPLPELIARVQRDEPARLRPLCPAVGRDLEAVVHKCLEKRPDHRYATAGELAADLGRVLDGEPVTARAVGTMDRAWKWVKRRPAIAALYGSITALIVVALSSVFWQQHQQLVQQKERVATDRQARASEKVNALAQANIANIPFIVNDLKDLRDVADPLLRQKHNDSSRGSPARLAYALALLPSDPSVVDELLALVPTAKASEILVLRDALKGHPEQVAAIWPKFVELHAPNRVRAPGVAHEPAQLPLAAMLCGFLPADERWKPYEGKLAAHLVSLNPLEAAEWQFAFVPLRKRLTPELYKTYVAAQSRLKSGETTDAQDTISTASRFDLSADLLARFVIDDPATLAELLQIADARHYRAFLQLTMPNAPTGSLATQVVQQSAVRAAMRSTLGLKPPPNASDADIEALAIRQANAATTLLHLGEPQHAWKMLVHTPDPTARSYLIHGLIPRGVDFVTLIRRYNEESDISAKRALLLALGEYTPSIAWRGEHRALIQLLLREFRDHPDPGLHGAIDWLLRQKWGKAAELDKIVAELAQASRDSSSRERQRPESAKSAPLADSPGPKRKDWFVNAQGQTYTIIRGPVDFMMGSPPGEPGRIELQRGQIEFQYKKKIPRSFAIAAREATVADYLRFKPAFDSQIPQSMSRDGPVNITSWYAAASYCNWLSLQDGIPESQWCYPTDPSAFKQGMTLPDDFLDRTGYRLPTEAEWEYACRAGSETARYYGRGVELFGNYGWYIGNARDQLHASGLLRPNDFGLFDMLGNASEWCEDAFIPFERDPDDRIQVLKLSREQLRFMRGGSFSFYARDIRSAARSWASPEYKNINLGFRPARTNY